MGGILLMVRALRRRVARESLFPRLSLSRKNVRESVKQALKLAAVAQAAQGGDTRLAGGALGRVRRGGAAGHLRGRAKSRQRGGGGRGWGYLLSGVRGEGERLRWPGAQFGRTLVSRARLTGGRVDGYSSRATAHGGGGKEFGKPVDKPFGFLVNGECSWGGGGREGGSGGGGGSGELGGVDRTTGVCNSQSVSGVLHRCSMTR